MPCYGDTILRIKYVNLSERGDNNMRAVWAIGTYPVECEDSEIELVLFVPMNSEECDYETQAIFEKDCFYSVGGKIVPAFYKGKKRPKIMVSISTCVSIFNKGDKSNKCPLKASLVGVPQELPRIVENDDIGMFKLLISDYVGQEHSNVVKIVFLRFNPRFVNLKIRPQNSIIFVVGQLEVIDSEFYVYAKDITYINTYFSSKLNAVDDTGSENSTEVVNSTYAKLLSTHHNIVENSKDSSEVKVASASKVECSDEYMNTVDNISNNEFKVNEDIDSDGDCNNEDSEVIKKEKRKKSAIRYNKRGEK
ncbi:hypothetical protein F8M41_012203 [Gigaspora margarita]|uniref:Uncharacterized protein n=1 Tax=Gigaspora margarita TaxID=4874 RepID=A0A8H4EPS0_GIGMA|nr:hypothetical protein F8M41_012203 [Gigaspora margarita]